MLTSDLIRYHIRGNEVSPSYITQKHADATYLKVGEELTQIYLSHQGKTKRELDSTIEALEENRTDYKIIRGLAKLLEENCIFRPVKEINFPHLRNQIFSLAQTHYPIVSRPDLLHKTDRKEIITIISNELNLSRDEIDTLIYGDLPENQILLEFNSRYTKETLLRRYNLALAQGLLYQANRLKISLRSDYRVVFQYIKLARLIHWIKPFASGGYEIILGGPFSLFQNTQRYGIRMANFLPGLLLAKNWEMTADIKTHQGLKQFHLTPQCGLHTHYTDISPFDSQIEKRFFHKFSRKSREWTIEREGEVINLGGEVFIPDFTFRHENGQSVSMEIIGFWTPEYLGKKMDKIRNSASKNLILAVNKSLNCSKKDFHGDVIYYRSGIKLKDVLDCLKKISNIIT